MLRISRQFIHPTKGNALLIFLILLLSLGLASYFLQSNPDEAQAQGTNIQDILHISNTAPSVKGDWQTSGYGAGRGLWRYRSDNPYNAQNFNHYECWQTIDVGTPLNPIYEPDAYPCEPNQSTLDYSLNLNARSANYGVRRNEPGTAAHQYEFGFDRNRIVNQTPFLVVGHTTTRGFDDPDLQLDLWIPATEDIKNLRIDSLDRQAPTESTLCNNDWDHGNKNVAISIQGEDAGQKQTIIAASAVGCRNPSSTITSDLGGPKDTALLTINPGIYKEYKKYIITATGPDSDSYTNQFRLNITHPADSFLVAAASNNYLGEIEHASSFNISSRLPGGSTNHKLTDQYKRLEILWETTLYVAPNSEDGCSYSDDKYVGIYDSDYPSLTQSWMIAGSHSPRLEISSVNRNTFLDSPSGTTFVPEPNGNLIFNGRWDEVGERTFDGNGNPLEFELGDTLLDVDQNEWEDKLVHFEGDKIYKLRFYNIDQRTWIQLRLPFDQINAMQKCAFKPLFKVFYSDISAGGRFGLGETSDACRNQIDIDAPNITTTYAGLYAHTIGQRSQDSTHFTNVKDSSSAEYGVRVHDTVQTFYSGFKNTLYVPTETKRLTFANPNVGPYYGGNFGKSRCIPNYWRGTSGQQFTPLPNDELNIWDFTTHATAPTVFHQPNSGGAYVRLQNIYNSAPVIIDLRLKATIYIEGDLLIENDIYNNSSGTQWKNFNDINYITIIVKGDILIDPNVSRIDAVLIAYPNTGADIHNIEDDKKGRIYTCYFDQLLGVDFIDDPIQYTLNKKTDGSTALITNSKLYNNNCETKLVVNGALIAREIHLGRTYVNTTQPYVVGYAVSEEINLLPEYFIGTPNLPGFEDWLHRSDSIHILPVNF